MDGQINFGNIIVGVAIVLVVVFMAYNLGQERNNRPDSFIDGSTGGVTGQGVHFITARTYGLNPKTVTDTARVASVKAGGGGRLYGTAQSGASAKQIVSGKAAPAATGNPHVRPQHTEANDNPLLRHQRIATGGNVPTAIGDPIRTPTYVGPSVRGYRLHTYNQPWNYAYTGLTTAPDFASQIAQTEETEETKAARPQDPIIDGYRGPYDIGSRGPGGPDSLGPGSGPYPGMPMGVPVPRGTLKKTSEKYGYPFYKASRPLKPYDYFKPFGPNQNVNQDANYVDTPFYARQQSRVWDNPGTGLEYDRGGIFGGGGDIPFISSVDAFAPGLEVDSAYEKRGILQTVDEDDTTILNVYARPIAPLQDLFRYTVQDKDGFIVPLKQNYLENGDIVPEVIGKEALGKWRFRDFVKDKYIWV